MTERCPVITRTNLKKENHLFNSKTILLSHRKARCKVWVHLDDFEFLYTTLLFSRVCKRWRNTMDGHAIHILSITSRQPFNFAFSNLEPMDARRCNSSGPTCLCSLIPASTLSIANDSHATQALSFFFFWLNLRSVWLGHRHAGIFQPTAAACGSGFLSHSLVVAPLYDLSGFFWFVRRFSVKFPSAPR